MGAEKYMAKYQTRPTVVEATQWFKPGDHEKVVEVINYPEGVAVSEFDKETWKGIGTVKYAVVLKHSIIYVKQSDWIVGSGQGIQVMTNSDFRRLYEPVK
ncbi:MAG TPA: hypothetical protein VN922_24435 [Bacteroidia bacterium]|nr:hypothetical protein [Bacteroidia bacterium]